MLITYAATFGITYGRFATKLSYLEQKMDRHNNAMERLAVVERDLKSAWHAIDDLKDDLKD